MIIPRAISAPLTDQFLVPSGSTVKVQELRATAIANTITVGRTMFLNMDFMLVQGEDAGNGNERGENDD